MDPSRLMPYLPPVATDPELEQRILSNPDDLSAYLVYGDWLLDQRDAFVHLAAIDVTHHYVTPDVAAELANLGPRVVLANPQEVDVDGDDEYRYVTVSE